MSLITTDVHTFGGRQAHSHIPSQPFWVFLLRIWQFIMAIVTLGLSAYCLTFYAGSGPAAFGMNIFTSIWTIIILAYIFVTALFVPSAYNMWAHLVLECFSVLWWLVSFALQGSIAAAYSVLRSEYRGYNYGYDPLYRASTASAVLGAFTWLTFIATTVWLGLQIHRIREVGVTDSEAAAGVSTGPTKLEHMGGAQPPANQQYVSTGHPETQHPSTFGAAPEAQPYGAAPAEPQHYTGEVPAQPQHYTGEVPAQPQQYTGEAPASQPYGGAPVQQQHYQ